MSSSNGSAVDSTSQHSAYKSFRRSAKKGCCAKGNWSAINIAAMVISFILFWPLGLVVLYWNISGRDLKDLPTAIQDLWAKLFHGRRSEYSESENSVFDDYQQTQYDRISEIREEIKSRASRFNIFRSDAKRRADEEEFRNFMSDNPDSKV